MGLVAELALGGEGIGVQPVQQFDIVAEEPAVGVTAAQKLLLKVRRRLVE